MTRPTSPARRLALSLAWLVACAAVYVRNMPNAELTSDDGKWLLFADGHVLARHPLFVEIPSSIGTPMPAFPLYLHQPLLALTGTPSAIQWASVAFFVATHALLLAIGVELGSAWLGGLASALFLLSPPMLCYYSAKLCEVIYLPFFSALTLWLLLRYARRGRAAALAGAGASLACCVLIHGSAIILAPVLVFSWLFSKRERLGEFSEAGLTASWALLALLVGLGAWALGLGGDVFAPLRAAHDLLPGFNRYLEGHIGLAPWRDELTNLLSLECALLLFYFFARARRWSEASPAERTLFRWCALPLIVLMHSALVFREYPHQWLLSLYPGLFVAVAASVELVARQCAGRPRLQAAARPALAAALVLIAAASVLRDTRFIARSGGVGWHLASAQLRLAVADRILRHNPNPRVVVAVDPAERFASYGAGGWTAALVFARKAARVPLDAPPTAKTYYLFEEGGLGYAAWILNALRKSGAREVLTLGPVRVFEADRDLGFPGIPVLSRNPFVAI